jgi:selenocysteine-specific elongation factor
LVSGALDVESEVEIHPIRKRARVRGLQVHGETTASASAGQRTAVNLAGIDTESLHRGMVLSAPGRFEATNQIDCVFELLPTAKPLKHRSPVHFHSGTAEIEARIYFLDRRPRMKAGERTYVQFRLDEPTLLLPGDRFIVRRFSPVVTIGGGTVLDSLAPRHRLKDPWRERLEVLEKGEPPAVLAEHLKVNPYGLGAAEIVIRTAWLESEIERTAGELEKEGGAVMVQNAPLWLAHRESFQIALDRGTALLAGFHQANPLAAGMVREELRGAAFPGAPAVFADAVLGELVRTKKVVADGDLVRLATHRMVLKEDEQQARDKIVGVFRDSGLTVPVLKELIPKLPVDAGRANKLLQVLLREGELVRVSADLVFHRDAIGKLQLLLREQKAKSDRIPVPLFKDLAGVSRKYAIPLLEYLDRAKITRRVGDERIIL